MSLQKYVNFGAKGVFLYFSVFRLISSLSGTSAAGASRDDLGRGGTAQTPAEPSSGVLAQRDVLLPSRSPGDRLPALCSHHKWILQEGWLLLPPLPLPKPSGCIAASAPEGSISIARYESLLQTLRSEPC